MSGDSAVETKAKRGPRGKHLAEKKKTSREKPHGAEVWGGTKPR